MQHDHWVPDNKSDLVRAVSKKWPEKKSTFKAMAMSQLYAIWFKMWSGSGCPACDAR